MKHARDESLPNERWLPVVGYEGWYDVSDYGRVQRVKAGAGTWLGRMINGSLDSHGYLHLTLYNDGVKHQHRIHRIVTEAFLGECPDGKEVNHLDGDKTNNRIDNLEYVTRLENVHHAHMIGIGPRGERHGSSKLTEDDVREIRRLIGQRSHRSIAKLFNVSNSQISNIRTGKTWSWLQSGARRSRVRSGA